MCEKSELRLQVLGGFSLTLANSPQVFAIPPRIQVFLAYLAIHKVTPQSRTHIAFMFWPDSCEEQAHANLRKLIFHLHKEWSELSPYFHFNSGSLQFNPSVEVQIDHEIFISSISRAVAARRRGEVSVEEAALDDAIRVYNGDFLPGFYDEWIVQEREYLAQQYKGALHHMVELLGNRNLYHDALNYALELFRQDPLHEENCIWLIRLYMINHDRTAAIRIYQVYKSRLASEMGEEPDPKIWQVYEKLLKV
jgi:DNA-binding SARP family transcriptional activator